jgi:hypothetical protein
LRLQVQATKPGLKNDMSEAERWNLNGNKSGAFKMKPGQIIVAGVWMFIGALFGGALAVYLCSRSADRNLAAAKAEWVASLDRADKITDVKVAELRNDLDEARQQIYTCGDALRETQQEAASARQKLGAGDGKITLVYERGGIPIGSTNAEIADLAKKLLAAKMGVSVNTADANWQPRFAFRGYQQVIAIGAAAPAEVFVYDVATKKYSGPFAPVTLAQLSAQK